MKKLLFGLVLMLFVVGLVEGIAITAPSDVKVEVTYISTEAALSNEFGLWLPHVQYLGKGHITPPGTVYDLGTFYPGDNLIFYIYNGNTFYSEGVSDDGVVHGVVTPLGNDIYQLGFEDLWGGGDRDYNDIVLKIAIIPRQPPGVPVPEFSSMMIPLLLIIGLLGMVLMVKTRNS